MPTSRATSAAVRGRHSALVPFSKLPSGVTSKYAAASAAELAAEHVFELVLRPHEEAAFLALAVGVLRAFCQRECGTQEQREKLTEGYTEAHNDGLYRKMAELGWLGVTIPDEYGGSDGGMLEACLLMEESSRGLAPIGGYATTLIVAGATQRFGTDDQKRDLLGGIARGEVEAIAMTEPEAGSDVGSLATSADSTAAS